MHRSRRLIVQTLVFSRSYLHRQMSTPETPSTERRNYWADEFCLKMPDFHVTFSDLLHAVNLRHGTNGFTSPPKEGVLRIFFALEKIRRLRPGLNPRTWVPKPRTLPLDHRSRRDQTVLHGMTCLIEVGRMFELSNLHALLRGEEKGECFTHQYFISTPAPSFPISYRTALHL